MRMSRLAGVVLTLLVGLSLNGCQPTADTIFFGDNIVTMDPDQPTVEAVAVLGETITAAGSLDDVMAMQGDHTRMVDLGANALLPGFIDSHSHFTGAGRALDALSLHSPPVGDVTNIDELVAKTRRWIDEKEIPPGETVSGGGYDDSLLEEGRHPTRYDLDRISTEHPIIVRHVSGHLSAANSLALANSDITADTPDPEGGHIRRVAGSNEPDGVLEERAGRLLSRGGGGGYSQTADDLDELARKSVSVYNGYGVTTIQWGGGTSPQMIRALREVAAREPLNADIAVYSSARGILDDSVHYERTYTNGVRVAAVKLLLDGSPQGRTAWVTEPYVEGPPLASADYVSYPTMEPDSLKALVVQVIRKGVPVSVHCNGDAASDVYLDGVEEAIAGMDPKPDHRSVIIHAQIMREDQMDRVAELGVVPSFFSSHVFYWGDWHRRSFGEERASNISATAWARDRGVHYTIHTDAMVVPPNMMRALSITVNRKTRSDYVLGPHQRATVMEALNALTLDAAYQYFEEDTKGSITVGKQADFVILGENPLTVDPAELEQIPIVETISRGRSVYQR